MPPRSRQLVCFTCAREMCICKLRREEEKKKKNTDSRTRRNAARTGMRSACDAVRIVWRIVARTRYHTMDSATTWLNLTAVSIMPRHWNTAHDGMHGSSTSPVRRKTTSSRSGCCNRIRTLARSWRPASDSSLWIVLYGFGVTPLTRNSSKKFKTLTITTETCYVLVWNLISIQLRVHIKMIDRPANGRFSLRSDSWEESHARWRDRLRVITNAREHQMLLSFCRFVKARSCIRCYWVFVFSLDALGILSVPYVFFFCFSSLNCFLPFLLREVHVTEWKEAEWSLRDATLYTFSFCKKNLNLRIIPLGKFALNVKPSC